MRHRHDRDRVEFEIRKRHVLVVVAAGDEDVAGQREVGQRSQGQVGDPSHVGLQHAPVSDRHVGLSAHVVGRPVDTPWGADRPNQRPLRGKLNLYSFSSGLR